MKLIVRHRPKPAPTSRVLESGPGIAGLSLSGLLHTAVVALLFLAPAVSNPHPQTLYSQIINAPGKKIVWYPLHKLPRIEPPRPIGKSAVAQGTQKRPDVMIRLDPVADPGQKLLWRPDTTKVVKEIPSQTVIAVEESPRPVTPLKPFVAPAQEKPVETRQTKLSEPPTVTAGVPTGSPLSSQLTASPKIWKPFVPPPAKSAPHPTTQLPTVAAPANDHLPVGTTGPPQGALDAVLRANHPAIAAPSSSKGSGGSSPVALPQPDRNTSGDGTVKAAMLSTAPVDKSIGAIPEGSHPAQISQAPTVGPTSSGKDGGDGLRMAGVTVRPANSAANLPPPTPTLPPKPVVYEETRIAASQTTLSAPLRPNSRIIPNSIDSHFKGRVVYSMIVTRPKLPLYAEDWILWFSEKAPGTGPATVMRSPLPVRKYAPVPAQTPMTPAGRIQIAATILKNGHVEQPHVLNGLESEVTQAAIKDLESWQFLPALRAGEPVDVEAIIEIVFQAAKQ